MATNSTPSQLVQDCANLVSLPEVVLNVNEMIRDSRYSAAAIGEVIATDPALTVKLLKIVNSSFYGFRSRIDTMERAITVIGMRDLHNLVLAACAVDRFDRIPQDLVDMTDFWMRSINSGIISRSLAKHTSVLHCERLFTAGLLHNIGSLLFYSKMPDASREILLAANGDRRLIPDLEREIIGFTYADIGNELARHWKLPEALEAAIGHHLDPDKAGIHRVDATLVYLGTRFSHVNLQGCSVEETLAEISSDTLDLIGLPEEKLLEILNRVPEEFAQIVNLILPSARVAY